MGVFLCGLVFFASGWSVTPVEAYQTTIKVPDDYPTIQEAINAASPGDTIQVAAGTYYELVTVNKTVTLTGENPLTTIIDHAFVVRNVSNVVISGFTIRNGGDGVFLNYCRDCVVSNNIIVGFGRHAVNLEYSDGNTVHNNTLSGHYYGISLFKSDNNVFISNKISRNIYEGLRIVQSSDNLISGNEISENGEYGINLLIDASGNIIEGNTISENGCGIVTLYSNGNIMYHNNFIDNGIYMFSNETNLWDDGYPSGGNYWSFHNPPDLYSGPYQNETGGDGIGDEPYIINEENADSCPLIYPYGYDPSPDLNDDGIVDIYDVVLAALAFGSRPGDENWNPYADLIRDGIIDIFDIVTIAVNYGRTTHR